MIVKSVLSYIERLGQWEISVSCCAMDDNYKCRVPYWAFRTVRDLVSCCVLDGS